MTQTRTFRYDPVALVAGLLAIVAGGLFLLDDLSESVDLPLEALWPAGLVALALTGATAAVVRWRRG